MIGCFGERGVGRNVVELLVFGVLFVGSVLLQLLQVGVGVIGRDVVGRLGEYTVVRGVGCVLG